jgi:hypothetical protein
VYGKESKDDGSLGLYLRDSLARVVEIRQRGAHGLRLFGVRIESFEPFPHAESYASLLEELKGLGVNISFL